MLSKTIRISNQVNANVIKAIQEESRNTRAYLAPTEKDEKIPTHINNLKRSIRFIKEEIFSKSDLAAEEIILRTEDLIKKCDLRKPAFLLSKHYEKKVTAEFCIEIENAINILSSKEDHASNIRAEIHTLFATFAILKSEYQSKRWAVEVLLHYGLIDNTEFNRQSDNYNFYDVTKRQYVNLTDSAWIDPNESLLHTIFNTDRPQRKSTAINEEVKNEVNEKCEMLQILSRLTRKSSQPTCEISDFNNETPMEILGKKYTFNDIHRLSQYIRSDFTLLGLPVGAATTHLRNLSQNDKRGEFFILANKNQFNIKHQKKIIKGACTAANIKLINELAHVNTIVKHLLEEKINFNFRDGYWRFYSNEPFETPKYKPNGENNRHNKELTFNKISTNEYIKILNKKHIKTLGEEKGKKEIFRLIIQNTSELFFAQDDDGNTALHYAAQKGQLETMKAINDFLLKYFPKDYKFTIETKNFKGENPLCTAIKAGQEKMVETLLEMDQDLFIGCDACITQTALEVAKINNNKKIIEIIENWLKINFCSNTDRWNFIRKINERYATPFQRSLHESLLRVEIVFD